MSTTRSSLPASPLAPIHVRPGSRSRRRGVAVALCLTLAACSGGGGSSPPSTPSPAPQPQPQPQPPNPSAAAFARLWVPHYNAGELRAWNRASLQADRDNAPDVVVTLPGGTGANAVLFEPTGALWVTDNANDRLLKFGAAQLQASGQPTPQVVIDTDGTSLDDPIGLAFDRADNLWVAVGGRVEMYEPDNLDDSGPTTPNRVLENAQFDLPAQLLFDAAGNLWVANASFTQAQNAVMVFTPAQLAAGGVQEPQLVIRSDAFALIEGMQFDRAGNLWVASNDGLSVARFAAAQVVVPAPAESRRLTPTGSLEADADDTATGRSVRKPGGIAFDRDGNLFVNSQRGAVNADLSAVLFFTAAQLAGLTGGQAMRCNVLVARATSNPGFGGLALQLP